MGVKIGREHDANTDLGVESGCLSGSQDGGEANSFKGGACTQILGLVEQKEEIDGSVGAPR